jgi:hypothetical protein
VEDVGDDEVFGYVWKRRSLVGDCFGGWAFIWFGFEGGWHGGLSGCCAVLEPEIDGLLLVFVGRCALAMQKSVVSRASRWVNLLEHISQDPSPSMHWSRHPTGSETGSHLPPDVGLPVITNSGSPEAQAATVFPV